MVSVHSGLAFVLLKVGDVEAAEREAASALDGAVFSADRIAAFGTRASVELALDRPEAALALAERGLGMCPSALQAWAGSLLYLARARALHTLDRTGAALDAIREARNRLTSIAATLPDAELREAYIEIDPNRHTLQLAREWLAQEPE